MTQSPSPSQSPTVDHSSLQFNRKYLFLIVGIGLLTVVVLLILGGGRDAIDALLRADWRFIALALLVHYSGFAVRGHRWQQLLKVMGHRRPYTYTTSLLISGWFISALVPARAGEFLRIGVLNRSHQNATPVPIADGLSSIVLERVLDIVAILVLGATFGGIVMQAQLPSWILWSYLTGVTVLIIFGLSLLIAPILLSRLRTLFSFKYWESMINFAAQIVSSLRMLGRHPQLFGIVVIESLYIWLCDAILLWLVLQSMDQLLPFGTAAFIALTTDIFAAIPLTPGGVGQIEAAYAALLSLLPSLSFNVSAVVLLTRGITYWTFLIFSGVVTFAGGFGQVLTKR